MFGSVTLAAATAANLFLSQFGGTWTCGNNTYHATWTIAQAAGDSAWATVTYGDPAHPGGVAYVGWLPQDRRYVYHDFHSDGAFAQLSAPAPKAGTWSWTGDYYPVGGERDSGPYITWVLNSDGAIERHYFKKTATGLEDRGSDRCTRLTLKNP